MKRFEYKIIRMKRGIRVGLSKTLADKELMKILTEMGDLGWDLKSETIWSIDSVLIFRREKK